MTLGRLVVGLPMTQAVAARAASEFDAVQPDRPMSMDQIAEAAAAHNAEAILLTAGMHVSAGFLDRLPADLKVIATASVGYDHIDVAAASKRGVVVTNTPDVVTDATADTTMLLLLGASRRAKEHVRNMEGGWKIRNGFDQGLGWEVTGKTLGIVGMGRIGRAVAQRARGFDMPIVYHNRRRLAPELEQGARYFDKLDDMLPHCQVLSLNLPGGQGVLMTAEKFALLPRGAVFVNSARGSLVDEGALIWALASGQLAAAGLDVFQKEPAYDTRLNDLPNTFLLPHIGSATEETRNAMGFRALDNIAAVLSGRPAPDALKA
ncbi:MAG: D-glycerate dehydrogenase [Alphaproteobacteria bacterium]|nr:D-glycerate dehydrogenase [Alphaproteobacteria bacterium]